MKLTGREQEIVKATIMLHNANLIHNGFVPDYYLRDHPFFVLLEEDMRDIRSVVQDVALEK